ncbi:MAG TPA: hypothetical protein VNX68_00505 [Nitrosopumilaceae archaeon]|jgi:hypothetical protein|nr:hypothetical protein [Nitrosopumilaceae archaeon]
MEYEDTLLARAIAKNLMDKLKRKELVVVGINEITAACKEETRHWKNMDNLRFDDLITLTTRKFVEMTI